MSWTKRLAAAALSVQAAMSIQGCVANHEASIEERLQGNWKCEREFREGRYIRSDSVYMELLKSNLKYSFKTIRICADSLADADGSRIPSCDSGSAPMANGYFEGAFRIKGDTLEAVDGDDTLIYKDIQADDFSISINENGYLMKRTQ
jgi:hypothetical protein